jgi:uncharacterized cupin superfamily protein
MTMPLPQRLSLDALSGPAKPVAAERVTGGHPGTRLAAALASEDRKFDVGIWEATEGSWRTSYVKKDELMFLLAGRLRLTATSGEAVEFGPGEAFVVPAGWAGEVKILEAVRKLYAIYQS